MKSLVLSVLPVVASAGLAAAEPAGGASIDENPQPLILAEKPLRTRVWEDIAPDRILHAANTNKIYLNRCAGGCLVTRGTTDSRTNRSSVPNVNQGSLSAFSRGDTVWNNVVSCVRDVFSPFGVEIVTTDPGNVNHFEIMIAGTPGQLGLSNGVGGISPYNCNAEYIPNSLVFVFDVWDDDVEDICSTAAQEIAHSFRLDHVTDPSDPLTYFNYNGRRRFKDAQVQCGSDCQDFDNNAATPNTGPFGQVCTGTTINLGAQNHTCTCTGQNTQNSVSVITALFGTGTPTPPDLTITQPKTGDNVMPGFPVAAEAMDDNGIGMVELRVNGMLAGTANQFPYVFNAPATLGDGTHTVEVTAYDNFGASAKQSVQVIIGKPCGKPSDCPKDTDTCVGGRCVPGSGVQGGLGTACTENTACASGQCAADSTGAMYCVEQCDPAKDECPSGFGCIVAGAGGVCWPGADDGGGCQTGSTGAGAFAFGLSFVALLWSRRRRK
jgi:MYXO-CTERM domain-containing protein